MSAGIEGLSRCIWAVACLTSSAVVWAQDNKPATDARAINFETVSHVIVRPDRTHQNTHTVRLRINQESAIATAGQVTLNYTEGMETLTVTEAYTLKPDGRRIPLDPATILTRDAASGLGAVYLRDAKTKTLIFPQVEVADTLVYTSIKDVTQASFEGQFNYGWVFNRAQPWTGAMHTIELPASMTLNIALRGADPHNGLTHVREVTGDTTRHVISFKPQADSMREEAGAVSVSDREPGFTLTTLPDFKALADIYWRDAAPKAAVTAEIQALAAEITRGQSQLRGKVDAIDRWLKRNVRYVAVYLGRERWIPHPASVVLVNRYGDCKDMAVLMTALLQAAGVTSEHVLINLGTAYTLPELPSGPLNHVIVYVPDAGLYLDPTATLSTVGMLSGQTYDKPAVHVSDAGARLARTPAMVAAEHVTGAKTVAFVDTDGGVNGVTTQTATGIFASSARAAYLRFQGQGFQRAAEGQLQAIGTAGSGTFEATSPSELREPYVVKATFKYNAKMALPLSGNRRMPVGLPVHARPGTFLFGTRSPDRKHAFVCLGGTQMEELELTFADGLTLPRVPLARTIETNAFRYSATYGLDGRTFKMKRTFESRVNGQVCPAELEAEIGRPLQDVQESLGTVLVFGAAGSIMKKR